MRARNDFLRTPPRFLFFPHARQSSLERDSEVWLRRPLKPYLELGAARNAMFLLDLRRMVERCLASPRERATEALLGAVRDIGDAEEAAELGRDPGLLPGPVRAALPNLKPRPERIAHLGILDEEERTVFNTVGQIDPNLIFSKDTLHQKADLEY